MARLTASDGPPNGPDDPPNGPDGPPNGPDDPPNGPDGLRNGPDGPPNGPDGSPNGPDGGAGARRLRPFSLTKPKIITHLRLQVWGIQGPAIYQIGGEYITYMSVLDLYPSPKMIYCLYIVWKKYTENVGKSRSTRIATEKSNSCSH